MFVLNELERDIVKAFRHVFDKELRVASTENIKEIGTGDKVATGISQAFGFEVIIQCLLALFKPRKHSFNDVKSALKIAS